MVRSPRKQPRTPDLHRDLGVSWQSVGPEQMPMVAVGAGDSAETPCHCDRVTASGAMEQLCQETTQSPRSQSPQVSAQTRSPRGGGPSSQQCTSGQTRACRSPGPAWKCSQLVFRLRVLVVPARAARRLPREQAPAGPAAAAHKGGFDVVCLSQSCPADSPTEYRQYHLHTPEPNVSFSPWEQTIADGTFWKPCQRVTKDVNLTIRTQQRGPLVNKEQFQTRKKLKKKKQKPPPKLCSRRHRPEGGS